jgi:branched-chain amino acid transport system ATP-binding protein
VTVPLLRIRELCAGYGQTDVLHGVEIDVSGNEIVCLIGPNGAGKTTTMRAITGLLPPSSGSVLLEGRELAGASTLEIVAAGIALVPEGRAIFPALTVRENLRIGAYSRRREWSEEGELANVFELFPRLRERQDQLGGTLSGGEQQMLAIGRALMAKPKLLLLDEPSMGLAPILVALVFDTIRRLAATGVTILLVEQNAEAALRIADRAYILERGRVVTRGAGRELLMNADVRASYLGVA